MRRAHWIVGLGISALVLGAGCDMWNKDKDMDKKGGSMSSGSGTRTGTAANQKSLYERLGGEPAIRAVCEDFVGRAASNPKVNFFRKNVPGVQPWQPSDAELATFKQNLVDFVCVAAGGPQKYKGESMKASHEGMKITNAEFDAIAADLAASLDKFKVPAKEKGELMAAVAATRNDIVEVK